MACLPHNLLRCFSQYSILPTGNLTSKSFSLSFLQPNSGLFCSQIRFSVFPSIVFVCSSVWLTTTCWVLVNRFTSVFAHLLAYFPQYCFTDFTSMLFQPLAIWRLGSLTCLFYIPIYLVWNLHQILFSHCKDIAAKRRAAKKNKQWHSQVTILSHVIQNMDFSIFFTTGCT